VSSNPLQPHQQPSLYRRHRPRTFAEVVGQEPVVRTLSNAVQRDRVHHAYLFVGSRGTGKTSMAKILAACLNCEGDAGRPTVDPCGKCQSCMSIASASSLDVIEMDAASNNSVDDIRDLRESVAYAPVSGGRKVYILDEAHMLSTAAWNAFLKTLEEPPPGTVFVLATTEAAKVPATVVDRCHRFDFHRPTVEQIASVVQRAADAESVAIPPEAVAALARAATGSFRDALGTLEQLITYSSGEIGLADVLAVLGVADARLLAEAVDAVAAGDARRALGVLEQCAEQGRDAALFAGDLEVRLRELLVVQTLQEVPAQLSLTPEADALLAEQAERVPHATVVRLLELVGEAMEAVRAGADARTRLELALVKAARPEADGSLRALLARIERLEQGGQRSPAPPSQAAAPGGGEARASAPAREPAPSAATVPAGGDAAAGTSASTQSAPSAEQGAAASTQSAPSAERGAAASEQGTRSSEQGAAASEQDPPSVEQGTPAPGASAVATGGEPGPPEAATSAAPLATAAPGAPPASLESVRSLWPAVVDLVRGENGLLGALIAEARPVAANGEDLILAFATTAQFLKKKAEDPANRMTVAEALHSVTGVRWQLSYELREVPADGAHGAGAQHSEEDQVRRFMDEFDAEEVPREGEDPEGAEHASALTSNEKGA
jgi:DNA polymerase-3 subunit gamma/tau